MCPFRRAVLAYAVGRYCIIALFFHLLLLLLLFHCTFPAILNSSMSTCHKYRRLAQSDFHRRRTPAQNRPKTFLLAAEPGVAHNDILQQQLLFNSILGNMTTVQGKSQTAQSEIQRLNVLFIYFLGAIQLHSPR